MYGLWAYALDLLGGGDAPNPAAAIGRILPLLPYTVLLGAAVMPLAGGLYLLTTTAWTAVEQAVLRRRRNPIGVLTGAMPVVNRRDGTDNVADGARCGYSSATARRPSAPGPY